MQPRRTSTTACFAAPTAASAFTATPRLTAPNSCPQRLQPLQHRRSRVNRYTIRQTSAPLSTSATDDTDAPAKFKVGDRVKVVGEEIFMYHFPKTRNEAVLVTGMTGTIIKDVSMQEGVKVSATSPYVVKLDDYPKSVTHFAEHEIEVIADEEATAQ